MPEVSIAREILNNSMENLLTENQLGPDSDWSKTVKNLLCLAREANRSFEYERAINYLDTLEEIIDSKGLPEFSSDLRIELHQEKGKAFASQGKYDQAINEYQKILKYCGDSQKLVTKSETFNQIGQLLAKQGDHDRALGYLQRAIGAYRRLDDKSGMCRALRNLGVVFVELGEFEEAEINYEEAIGLAEEIGDQILFADLINNLGAIKNMKGSWQEALALLRQSLEIYREKDQKRKSAYTENNLAITLAEKGMNDDAHDYFKRAYETAAAIKDASLTLIVDINLADLHLKRGELQAAKNHSQKAEEYLLDASLINGHLVEAKKLSGKIFYFEQQYDRALLSFNEAIEISHEIGARYLTADVLMERGTLYRAMGKHIEALSDLESSYHIYTTLKAEGKKEHTEEVIDSIEKLYLQIFDSMAREVDRKDKYTKGHSDRVASLALLLGKELGLNTHTLKTIVAASLLHDIGKIKIDDIILKKPGRLSEEEFKRIQEHPGVGVELLRGKEFPWDIKPLILHHHEKLDGSGYPLGLKGEDIPMGARIICIADVFDALTSDRVYRKAFETEKALEIMKEEAGTTFDPALLKCFTNMINQGKADLVINSHTNDDEMYGIWSRCKLEDDVEAEPIAISA
jgi:putative nucleotidyltransferase with HDIG domain